VSPDQPSPLDSLRDPRAILDTGLGPVAFVIVNAIWGLHAAAAVAVGIQIVLMLERLGRRKPVVNAVGGLLGTGLAVFIALRSGRAEGYFVPRMLYQLLLAVVFAGSVLVRRPLTAYIVGTLYRAEPGWVSNPKVRRVFSEVTILWAALFAVRAAIYAVLIAAGKPGGLAIASLVIGWPPFLILLWISFRYAPWRLNRLGAPPPRPAETP
jgi:hypothetical protein